MKTGDFKMTNNKIIARRILDVIGGPLKVVQYKDTGSSSIDIFIGENKPDNGLASYSTIGLSDYTIGLKISDSKELRLEILGVIDDSYKFFPNIIATCAFNIINDGYACKPGIVFPNIVQEYYPDLTMKHIYFTSQFIWDSFDNVEFEDKIVTWLMAIPISDYEFDYLKANGDEAFEDVLQEKDIDTFDLSRDSCI